MSKGHDWTPGLHPRRPDGKFMGKAGGGGKNKRRTKMQKRLDETAPGWDTPGGSAAERTPEAKANRARIAEAHASIAAEEAKRPRMEAPPGATAQEKARAALGLDPKTGKNPNEVRPGVIRDPKDGALLRDSGSPLPDRQQSSEYLQNIISNDRGMYTDARKKELQEFLAKAKAREAKAGKKSGSSGTSTPFGRATPSSKRPGR
jgi:hypothetical protein